MTLWCILHPEAVPLWCGRQCWNNQQ